MMVCPECKSDHTQETSVHCYRCEDCGWKYCVIPGTKRAKESKESKIRTKRGHG